LTFDHAAEKVSDGDSGRSRVATIARQRIPAERLHPKATNWRSRPIPARGGFRGERPVYPWHLTFVHAAEKVSDRDSGRSRVATIARQRIPAERLHPKAMNWRCRPVADAHLPRAGQVSG